MKKTVLSAIAILAGSALVAIAGPRDDVTAAAQKLTTAGNYSWHTTVVVPEGSRFRPGPTDGKTDDGLVYQKMSFGDNTTEMYIKGTNAAVTDPDGNWQSLADLASDDQGPGRFMVGMIRNFRSPAQQAADLVADAQDLTLTNGVYSGNMTSEGAKKLLTFRRRGGNGANISDASGSVKFWVNDGELSKYEFTVKGTVTFNDNPTDVQRDTTVEIKDVGATKITVPDDAKAKMQ